MRILLAGAAKRLEIVCLGEDESSLIREITMYFGQQGFTTKSATRANFCRIAIFSRNKRVGMLETVSGKYNFSPASPISAVLRATDNTLKVRFLRLLKRKIAGAISVEVANSKECTNLSIEEAIQYIKSLALSSTQHQIS